MTAKGSAQQKSLTLGDPTFSLQSTESTQGFKPSKKGKMKWSSFCRASWCRLGESNPGPTDYESADTALPGGSEKSHIQNFPLKYITANFQE
jgi:hypothetical protein